MSGEIHLRTATLSDIPELNTLIERSARALSAGYYDRDQTEAAIRYVFGVDTQLIRDQTYYAVCDGGRIIACGGWSYRRTLYGGDQIKAAEDPALNPHEEAARIRAFFVAPEMARRAIGRMLLNQCIEAAAAAGFAELTLVATLPGEPLYRACGFEVVEKFDKELPDGVLMPLVTMKMRIKK